MITAFYSAAPICFIMSELEKQAEDIELRNSGLIIDFYARYSYWDFAGIIFFLIATMALVFALLYFRRKNLAALKLNG